MEKRDIDEFINIFFGTGEDYTKRAKEFLDKIGKHYEKLPGGIKGLQEIYDYIAERIKENKEIVEYIKSKDRSILTEFLYWMPEIFDNEFLKEVVEKKEEYGLSDISNIIMKINDIDYTKRIINEREKYDLSDYDIVQLVISLNDEDYTKEVIENYGIKDRVFLIQLIKSLTDVNYMINIVENKDKYKLQSNDVAELVKATENVDYIKEVVENFEQYGLENSDIVQLVKTTKDNEYIKNTIEKFEEYGFNGTNIIKLVASTNDFNYIKEFIRNREKYGIKGEYITDLFIEINQPEYTKEVIENWTDYDIDNLILRHLIVNIGAKDKEYFKKIILNGKNYEIDIDDIAYLIDFIPDEERMQVLEQLDLLTISIYRRNYAETQFIKDNLENFFKLEGSDAKKEILLKLAEKNQDVFKSDFRIFNEKYLDVFGEDILNQISCYQYVVNQLSDLNDEELKFFGKILNTYMNKQEGEEWTPFANRVLNNIDGYRELIENINNNKDFDINKLIPILVHLNEFNIETIEDIENLSEIKRKKCEELIKEDSIEEKKKAVLLKIFGQGLSETKEFVKKFGEDIEEIEDEDLKNYIRSLQEILDIEDGELLGEIFEKVDGIESLDTLLVERKLKTEYCKLYQKDLFKLKDAEILEPEEEQYGVPVYSAGTDFKMIITSVGAFCRVAPNDYKKDWNRPSLGSQHFCASYIRNDMLGHAPINHLCFAFEKMKEDSLMLSGPDDIYSSMRALETVSEVDNERYLAPDNQIRNTVRFNEMDFRRIQGGKKKQPDYIVVFRKNGKIDNIEKAIKASKDFSGLPIVVIDVEECLASEREKVKGLLEQYRKTGDSKIKEAIEEKLRNNRVTDNSFCSDMGIDEFLRDAPKKDEEVSMEDLEELYEEVTSRERQEESTRLRSVYAKIMKIKGERGNKNGERE